MKNINVASNRKRKSGFTLSGTLFNIAIASVVLASTGSFSVSNFRSFASLTTFPDINSKNQNASNLIAQDIRRASSVQSASAHQLVLEAPAAGTETVTYTYDAAARTLTRADRNGTQTLLTQVDCFSFSLFQQPAANAVYNALTPATASNAKAIACHWSCSRRFAGAKLDSESVQIAPVILRNRV
jgi:YD repeat-containing protein